MERFTTRWNIYINILKNRKTRLVVLVYNSCVWAQTYVDLTVNNGFLVFTWWWWSEICLSVWISLCQSLCCDWNKLHASAEMRLAEMIPWHSRTATSFTFQANRNTLRSGFLAKETGTPGATSTSCFRENDSLCYGAFGNKYGLSAGTAIPCMCPFSTVTMEKQKSAAPPWRNHILNIISRNYTWQKCISNQSDHYSVLVCRSTSWYTEL